MLAQVAAIALAGRPVCLDHQRLMRALITGSSGQIGTNLALVLAARGDEVRGIDSRPNEWTDKFATDVVDLVKLGRGELDWSTKDKPDVIVHLAAWAKVYQLVLQPRKAMENVEMSFAALELARKL